LYPAGNVSAVVQHELYYRAYKSANPEANLARIENLQFEVIDFDADDARMLAGGLAVAAGSC
jgi:predicted nucleic acid-binding protein